MKSHTTRRFREAFRDLPFEIQEQTRRAYAQLQDERAPQVHQEVQAGYVFVAMPIAAGDFDDVLDSIKEACQRCGLTAERIDEAQSNERITDRILESIRKAQFVIADLTGSRPNVFYEAGYAHGIGKVPIYIARDGTKLELDPRTIPSSSSARTDSSRTRSRSGYGRSATNEPERQHAPRNKALQRTAPGLRTDMRYW